MGDNLTRQESPRKQKSWLQKEKKITFTRGDFSCPTLSRCTAFGKADRFIPKVLQIQWRHMFYIQVI